MPEVSAQPSGRHTGARPRGAGVYSAGIHKLGKSLDPGFEHAGVTNKIKLALGTLWGKPEEILPIYSCRL